jgi:glycosyltransferase involved in cell wall biosynthesis
MKPIDHPVISGDLVIARLFLKIFRSLGYGIQPATSLSTRITNPSDDAYNTMEQRAREAVSQIIAAHASSPPEIVFCYHNYYKAPDLIGPDLAQAFGCPYVVAEASLATKRLTGPFARGELLARMGIAKARLIFTPTENDEQALLQHARAGQEIVHLPPFIDLAAWPEPPGRHSVSEGPLRLITVAMMRNGNKERSYAMLAEALKLLPPHLEWTLDIHGNGPARAEIEAAFAPLGQRIRFHGETRGSDALARAFLAADLFVWPAVNEPFGMVFLESQSQGLPCLAGKFGGVSDVVDDGATGILVPECTAQRFADTLAGLITERSTLDQMGRAALQMVRSERGLEQAGSSIERAFRRAGLPVASSGMAP